MVTKYTNPEDIPLTNPDDIPQQVPDKFDKAAKFTFRDEVEGGFAPNDTGGRTNHGITQTTLDNFNRKNGYDWMDVKDITKDDAKHVARKVFFEEPGLESLPDRVAVAAFDYSYNSGPHQAILDLQRVVGAHPDGKLGPQTLKAIDDYTKINGEDSLLHNYTENRAILMHKAILRDPRKIVNAEGWAKRLQDLKGHLNFVQIQQQGNPTSLA